jgi:hypothetical protein
MSTNGVMTPTAARARILALLSLSEAVLLVASDALRIEHDAGMVRENAHVLAERFAHHVRVQMGDLARYVMIEGE